MIQRQLQTIINDRLFKGKAIILRPSMDMGISRYTTDKEKLNKWYDLGYSDILKGDLTI